jgi:hypothetical protein
MKKRALVRLDRFFGSFSQSQPGFGKSSSDRSYIMKIFSIKKVWFMRLSAGGLRGGAGGVRFRAQGVAGRGAGGP